MNLIEDDVRVINQSTYDELEIAIRNALKLSINERFINEKYVNYVITLDKEDNVRVYLKYDSLHKLKLKEDEIEVCFVEVGFDDDIYEEYRTANYKKILQLLGILEQVEELLKGHDENEYYALCKDKYWYRVVETVCRQWYKTWYINSYLKRSTISLLREGLRSARIVVEPSTDSIDIDYSECPF